MGARGPAKTPTRVLARRGSWRAKIRSGEPEIQPGMPPKPKGMRQLAGEAWEYLSVMLYNMGVLTEADGPSLQLVCETYVEWYELQKYVRNNGRTMRGEKGRRVVRPEYKMLSDVRKDLRLLLREFGLSPSARASIKVFNALSDGAAKPIEKVT